MLKKIFQVTLILIAVFSISKIIVSHIKLFSVAFSGGEIHYPEITDAYFEIFPKKNDWLLMPSYTFFTRYKNPVATFKVDGGHYNLLVYKISNLPNKLSLVEIIKISFNGNNDYHSTDVVYNATYKTKNITFGDAIVKPVPVKTLTLNVNGEALLKPVFTDSSVYLKVKYNDLSVKYSEKGIVDFYSKTAAILFGRKVSIELMFLKKTSGLYMLLLSPNTDYNSDLKKPILSKLIN